MGIFDRFKKKEEDIGDLSDLGDFGLEEKPGAEPGMDDLGGGLGPLPSFEDPEKPGMQPGVPTHMEEVQPTAASKAMGEDLGVPSAPPPQAAARPAPQPSYPQGPGLPELAKDIEIIHAKLDAIKSSLDSVNQRLATLERMASGEGKTRYTW
ncbi:hypothetical protein KY349_05500 [Candidatus Woesearchaeota archaeon]|jgi:hypothetical protein|nr:hypothetical protein [Candidatus Woesearchaeota archaeon]